MAQSSSSSSSGEHRLAPRASPPSGGSGEGVVVPREVLKTIVDNLDRAEQAARAAARVMAGGANAFESEGNRIMGARMTIESLLHRAL